MLNSFLSDDAYHNLLAHVRHVPAGECRRFITVSDSYDGDNFFTVSNGVRMATPLLLALAVVELSDVAFAVDSIPAVCSLFTLLLHWSHSSLLHWSVELPRCCANLQPCPK